MNKFIKFTSSLAIVGMLFSAAPALAASPNLTLISSGGDNVTLTVTNADSNAPVQLNYIQPGSSLATTITNFGYTNGSGYFTTMVSGSSYGINSGSQVYVTINGQQSNRTTLGGGSGCGIYGCGGALTFSQNNLNLNYNQSQIINVYANGSVYIQSNSSPAVADAYVSGTNLTVTAKNVTGSTNINVCASGGACGNLYVTVGGGGYSGNTVSLTDNIYTPKVVNVPLGTSVIWTNNGSMPHTVTADDNSFNSSTLSPGQNFTRTFNTPGTFAYHCNFHGGSGGAGMSGVVIVGGGSSGSLSLSQTNVNLNLGQTAYVTASTFSGGYLTVTNNTNNNSVTATVSGSTINLYGNQAGTSIITVCASYPSACGTITVTVSGGGLGTLTFSNPSPALSVGQNMAVSIYTSLSSYSYYPGSYYINSNSNPGAVSASVSGQTLNLNGLMAGSATIVVCQSGAANVCGSIYPTTAGYGSSGAVTFSQNSLTLTVGQSQTVNVYGNGGYSYLSFYISSNSSPTVADAILNGSSLSISGRNPGTTTFNICQSTGGCGLLYVTVSAYGYGYGGGLNITTPSLSQAVVGQYYNQQLIVTGGSAPYTYIISGGGLPSGLSLSSLGQIFGTPSLAQNANFTVQVQDGFGRTAVQTIYLTVTGGSVLGISNYKSGMLLNEAGTVYMVYKNTRSGFVSRAVFEGLGFNFGQITTGSFSGLADSGYTIRTAKAAHPWGSWIKSGSTVYFEHDSGLIPVADYATFINNGGEDRLVVPANVYDFRQPLLSVMIYNDPRLK